MFSCKKIIKNREPQGAAKAAGRRGGAPYNQSTKPPRGPTGHYNTPLGRKARWRIYIYIYIHVCVYKGKWSGPLGPWCAGGGARKDDVPGRFRGLVGIRGDWDFRVWSPGPTRAPYCWWNNLGHTSGALPISLCAMSPINPENYKKPTKRIFEHHFWESWFFLVFSHVFVTSYIKQWYRNHT